MYCVLIKIVFLNVKTKTTWKNILSHFGGDSYEFSVQVGDPTMTLSMFHRPIWKCINDLGIEICKPIKGDNDPCKLV